MFACAGSGFVLKPKADITNVVHLIIGRICVGLLLCVTDGLGLQEKHIYFVARSQKHTHWRTTELYFSCTQCVRNVLRIEITCIRTVNIHTGTVADLGGGWAMPPPRPPS